MQVVNKHTDCRAGKSVLFCCKTRLELGKKKHDLKKNSETILGNWYTI